MFSGITLLFFSSFNLGPVQMASAWVFTTFGDSQVEVEYFPCAGSAERSPLSCADRSWDLWVRTIAYVG